MTLAQQIREWFDLYTIGCLALFAHVASKAGWWLITRSKRADRLAKRIERASTLPDSVLWIEGAK